MKARDGVFCLFEKVYHVLLRLTVGHLFNAIPVDYRAAVFPKKSVAIDGAGRA